jgi:superfamily II DNA or RNA helicase
MWDQPHYLYTLHDPQLSAHAIALEQHIPGVLAWAVRGRKKYRLTKNEWPTDGEPSHIDVYAPAHAAFMVEHFLSGWGITNWSTRASGGADTIGPWPEDAGALARMVDIGAGILKSEVARRELKPHVAEMATPYQKRSAAWAESRPWVMNIWPCGSGKTVGALIDALTRPGTILVICPAKARHVWWTQTQQYTNILPWRLLPDSERRKSDMNWDQYVQHCATTGQRRFVVVGAESLNDNLEFIKRLQPDVLILDELHIHGQSKRWKAVQQTDGTVGFSRRLTASGDKDAWSVAIMDVSRLPSLALRIGLTATPLDDGRPRRLWSQLDLLTPGGFAHSYRRFAERYCDATTNPYGGMDDKGSSNIDELRQRCSFFTHEVSYTESHSSLPPTRVQVVYLPVLAQDKAERYDDAQTFDQAIKQLARQARGEYEDVPARERLIEARLAEACSRKRGYVVSEALEGLKGGGKVIVFTARRREAERWGEAIRKTVSTGDEARSATIWVGHGGVSETERNDMIDGFRNSQGPCCLIGTGQAFGIAVDGMQTADLAIFAMLPWKPGDFLQWRGRFDRHGGRATLLKVVVASATYDERVVEILTDKFGPIEQFLAADELAGMGEKLLGMEDREALVDDVVSKLVVFDQEDDGE